MSAWAWTAWGDRADDTFDPAKVVDVYDDQPDVGRPAGGLWLARAVERGPVTAWTRWCETHGETVGRSWAVRLRPGARVLRVVTPADWGTVFKLAGTRTDLGVLGRSEVAVAWTRLAELVDAVEVSAEADAATRSFRSVPRTFGWFEVPSMLVLRASAVGTVTPWAWDGSFPRDPVRAGSG